jgi:hypothetical protein
VYDSIVIVPTESFPDVLQVRTPNAVGGLCRQENRCLEPKAPPLSLRLPRKVPKHRISRFTNALEILDTEEYTKLVIICTENEIFEKATKDKARAEHSKQSEQLKRCDIREHCKKLIAYDVGLY